MQTCRYCASRHNISGSAVHSVQTAKSSEGYYAKNGGACDGGRVYLNCGRVEKANRANPSAMMKAKPMSNMASGTGLSDVACDSAVKEQIPSPPLLLSCWPLSLPSSSIGMVMVCSAPEPLQMLTVIDSPSAGPII